MKRFLLSVLFFNLACGLVSAHVQDGVLTQMNAVKLNPEYIYGYGVMGDVSDACDEALQDLALRVSAYLKEINCSFLRTLEQCPEGTVHFLTYSKGVAYARAIAYVSKQSLRELEAMSAEEYENQGIGKAIEELKDRIVRAMTMEELEQALLNSVASALVTHGEVSLSTDDKYIKGGYIVYFDAKTGRIVEVRTPCDAQGNRKDARSGYPCEKTAPAKPYLIYIEEPNQY